MRRELVGRLKRLKDAQSVSSRNTAGTTATGERHGCSRQGGSQNGVSGAGAGTAGTTGFVPTGLDGWENPAPHVFRRTTEVRLRSDVASHPAISGTEPFHSHLLSREVSPDELLYLDTETTGLSGGAGTTVFLTGAGRCFHGAIHVTQILMTDFPGEPDYLLEVLDAVGNDRSWVSYNGKAFDSRLLEGRFLMNGIPFERPEQIDLLYPTRRLYRDHLVDCSLGTVEAALLSVARGHDIPGMEIPDRYFDFLRSGDASGLTDVFRHHLQDIVSLALLFVHLERVLDAPRTARGLDRFQLARWLLDLDRVDGIDLLSDVLSSPRAEEDTEKRCRAGILLGTAHRRTGDLVGAEEAWQAAVRLGSIPAAIELAKLYEHRLRDLDAARAVLEEITRKFPSLKTDPLIQRRAARIEGKRQGGDAGVVRETRGRPATRDGCGRSRSRRRRSGG